MTLALPVPESRAVVPTRTRWKARPTAWERFATPFDLNMAPFRYQKILKEDGGPIEHLERGRMLTPRGVFYNVNAYLVEHLRPSRRERSEYYGNADGGGTHLTELIARFMAVSEAIERWAFWDRVDSIARTVYGFDIDPTTTGMAAFPGLFHFRARRKARLEALERFGLLHWWEGRLGHRLHPADKDGCQVVEILVPDSAGVVVVVTFRDEPLNGTRSYGYGAGTCFTDAVDSARAEMLRHQMVLRRFVECHPDPRLGLLSVQAHQERRALYFGLTEGTDLFNERLKCAPWGRRSAPKTIFDGLVPGDWDRYASVWRALYEPPSEEYLSDRNDYFFW